MCRAHTEPWKGSLTSILDQGVGGTQTHDDGKDMHTILQEHRSQRLLSRTHLGFSATRSASRICLTKTVYRRHTVHYGGGTQMFIDRVCHTGPSGMGVVPASQALRQENREFKTRKGCVMRPGLKTPNTKKISKQKKKKSQVATVSSWFSQCYIVRPCLKGKKEKRKEYATAKKQETALYDIY